MKKILVCSHGNLSKGICESLKIISGPQENVDYITCYNDDIDPKEKIKRYLDNNKDVQIIALSDVFGGSVNQLLMMYANNNPNIKLITGFNFPLLIELALNDSDKISDEELEMIIENSRKQIMLVSEIKEELVDDFDF